MFDWTSTFHPALMQVLMRRTCSVPFKVPVEASENKHRFLELSSFVYKHLSLQQPLFTVSEAQHCSILLFPLGQQREIHPLTKHWAIATQFDHVLCFQCFVSWAFL